MPSNHCFVHKTSLNKEIKRQIAGSKAVQTLGDAMCLAQEAEITLKKYYGLNDDDPSVMQINSVLQSERIVIQGKVHSQ